jgi:hypothetical protein
VKRNLGKLAKSRGGERVGDKGSRKQRLSARL